MIISYLTETYFDWGLLFVNSFSLFHPNEKIYLSTRNLNKSQIKSLSSLSKNIHIDNKPLVIKELSKQYGIPEKKIEDSREGCNDPSKKKNHRLWMNITADGDRINSYLSAMENYKNEKFYMLTDIDLLFRRNIDDVFQYIMKSGDVGLKLRAGKKGTMPKRVNTEGKLKDALINISTVAIKNNSNGKTFIERWIKHVNGTPMKKKNGIKWGQYAICLTYNDLSDSMKFYKFKQRVFSPYLHKEAPVWFFKTKKKKRDYQTAASELKRIKETL